MILYFLGTFQAKSTRKKNLKVKCYIVVTSSYKTIDVAPSASRVNALGMLNSKMIDVARSMGAASKLTDNNGALITFCT